MKFTSAVVRGRRSDSGENAMQAHIKLVCAAIVLCAFALSTQSSAAVIFDDFNTNEGHFTSNVFNASGSDSNLANTSTHARITSDQIEGAGSQQLVLNQTAPNTFTRLRHLSGGGTPANNTAFTTSAGTDGWIGFYAKTTATGWTSQIFLEGASNNGSIEKTLISDGAWHLYEW